MTKKLPEVILKLLLCFSWCLVTLGVIKPKPFYLGWLWWYGLAMSVGLSCIQRFWLPRSVTSLQFMAGVVMALLILSWR